MDQGAKEKKVHLIPTKAQNSLVYGLKTPIETYQIYDALQPTLQKAWPRPSSEEYYSDWALKICTHVQRVIFDKPEIYYFDLNRLVSRYFIKLLSQKKLNNPYLWLFTQNNNLLASSGLNLGWFKNPADSYQKIFTPLDGWIDHPEKVLEDFISYNFVPSLFLVFSLLSFHLGIRVYGSYAQYEYYPTIGIWHENLWRQAGFDYKPSELSQNRFGYARLPSEITRFSLDYYTQGRKVNLSSLAKLPMQVFWASLL